MDMDENAEAVKSVTEKLGHANMGLGLVGLGISAEALAQAQAQAFQHLLPPHAHSAFAAPLPLPLPLSLAGPSPLAAAIAAGLPPPAFSGPAPVLGGAGLSAFQRPAQGVAVAPRLPVPA